MASVEVRIISDSMPEEDGFLMAFWDNVSHRRFDPACTAVIAKRLLELYPRDVVAKQFLPVLGVRPLGPRLEQLRALGSLEEQVLKALALGRIHEKTAFLLSRLPPHERVGLLEFTEDLGLNANKKAEVIERLIDLSIFHNGRFSNSFKPRTRRQRWRIRIFPRRNELIVFEISCGRGNSLNWQRKRPNSGRGAKLSLARIAYPCARRAQSRSSGTILKFARIQETMLKN